MRLPLLVMSLTIAAQDKPPASVPPKILYPAPLIAKPGATTRIVLHGLKLDGVSTVKTTAERAAVKLVGTGRKTTVPKEAVATRHGDSECDVEITIPADFTADSMAIIAVAPSGESAAYRLTITKDTTPEVEPNDGFTAAQAIQFPAAVDGAIGREKDVDAFRFPGKAGQKISVSVLAIRLGSPADLLLTLYDDGFNAIARSDDTRGKPDPELSVTLPRDGNYYLVLQESNDLGGPHFCYRLLAR